MSVSAIDLVTRAVGIENVADFDRRVVELLHVSTAVARSQKHLFETLAQAGVAFTAEDIAGVTDALVTMVCNAVDVPGCSDNLNDTICAEQAELWNRILRPAYVKSSPRHQAGGGAS